MNTHPYPGIFAINTILGNITSIEEAAQKDGLPDIVKDLNERGVNSYSHINDKLSKLLAQSILATL
ncbi:MULTISPECIES: hypothetical protein [unclassified Mucilaginibacter]|uniref:hypothetical protein n=1 Tax=unclassified Mucilaginibacter TaxID=2617802 RepID=UPI002AC9CAEA|nr:MULTISPECIES: hypothetical protein [unclassified Mucilaginibacter]MEB0260290.1 hypothetical protein [Mucilaginibacter sp. 10I4]MEB0277299.1 hypothetical protein [Mucilaginibacter sp. 10B2]MEB0302151.1 hypothetical protein [Mucilaginibacter sp. 5C4]WPX25426.1 hypothetical protein RHM67_09130 [Mucilaginibacter sp. 5C4]